MKPFLVISYDQNEQETFYDRVLARNERKAMLWVEKQRGYAVAVCAYTQNELRTAVLRLAERSAPFIRKEMRALKLIAAPAL